MAWSPSIRVALCSILVAWNSSGFGTKSTGLIPKTDLVLTMVDSVEIDPSLIAGARSVANCGLACAAPSVI